MKNIKKIILISGKARHGKDSTAKILKNKLLGKTLIISYADYLKFICQKYLNWNGNKDEEGRNILQQFGTDIVRIKKNKKNFWVDAVCNLIEVLEDEFDYFIIPDCRFINEMDIPRLLFKNVITLRVERLNYKSELTIDQQNHISETQLDNYRFDYIIRSENGLDKLEQEINKFIKYMEVNNGKEK